MECKLEQKTFRVNLFNVFKSERESDISKYDSALKHVRLISLQFFDWKLP